MSKQTSRRMRSVPPIKVYGLGDILSPKGATLTVDQRYQNVRSVAVHQTDQVPVLPTAQRS
jgi:hypothetical protein